MQIMPEIEIVVRDDSEDGETEKIARGFEQHLNLRYFKGKRQGLDEALLFLTSKANGKFVWWIGDDLLVPGALNQIISVLKNNLSIGFMWVNSADITNDKNLCVKDETMYFFANHNEVLKLDVGLLGFITATIFRRDLVLSGLPAAKTYQGSAFVCMYLILHVIAQAPNCYYFGKPMFLSEPKLPGLPRWYEPVKVFGINLFLIVKEFEGHFDKKMLTKALSKNISQVLRAILVEQAKGYKSGFASGKKYLPKLFLLYWRYPVIYLYLPLFLLPPSIRRIVYFARTK